MARYLAGIKINPLCSEADCPSGSEAMGRFFFTSQKTGEKFWVIVHLRDGRKVVGKYGERSFASTGAVPEQLYLEELHELKDGRLHKVPATKGGLFVQGSIEMLELFAISEEKDNGKE